MFIFELIFFAFTLAWFAMYHDSHALRMRANTHLLRQIRGETFLITGATRGIGAAILKLLLKYGAARVYVASRSAGKVDWGDSRVIPITYNASLATAKEQLEALFGCLLEGETLRGVFLNAGVPPDESDPNRVWRINYEAPRLLAEWLLERGLAHVVVGTGSFTALFDTPSGRSYTSAKRALRTFLLACPGCVHANTGVVRTGIWDDLGHMEPWMRGILMFFATDVDVAADNMVLAMLRGKARAVVSLDAWAGEPPLVRLGKPFYNWVDQLGAADGPNSWLRRQLARFSAWLARKFPERQG